MKVTSKYRKHRLWALMHIVVMILACSISISGQVQVIERNVTIEDEMPQQFGKVRFSLFDLDTCTSVRPSHAVKRTGYLGISYTRDSKSDEFNAPWYLWCDYRTSFSDEIHRLELDFTDTSGTYQHFHEVFSNRDSLGFGVVIENFYFESDDLVIDNLNTINDEVVLGGDLRFEMRIVREKYEFLDPQEAITYSGLSSEGENIMNIAWDDVEGALGYELQWRYADICATQSVYSCSEKFFDGAPTIECPMNQASVNLTYPKGAVYFRVRPIGRFIRDVGEDFSIPKWGQWTCLDLSIIVGTDHERELSWQQQTSFAEDGKYKKVISYYDQSLKNRQIITNLSSDDLSLVANSYYDYEGRSSIQVLPAPISSNSIAFVPDFDLYLTNQEPLHPKHFDNPTADFQGLSRSSGSSRYYSPMGVDIPSVLDEIIPRSDNFPLAQSRYLRDGTGRMVAQGGVGPEFQLGSGHETEYFYDIPSELHLRRLFGDKVGEAKYYKRNIVKDANGQLSVSYIDPAGRVVATTLGGPPPIEDGVPLLDALNSNGEEDFVHNLMENNDSTSLGSSVTTTLFNEVEGTTYTFHYDASGLVNQLADTCLICEYEWTFRITDPDGIIAIEDIQTFDLSNVNCNEESETYDLFNPSYSQVVILDSVGLYTVEKHLRVLPFSIEELQSIAVEKIGSFEEFQMTQTIEFDSTMCELHLTELTQELFDSIASQNCNVLFSQMIGHCQPGGCLYEQTESQPWYELLEDWGSISLIFEGVPTTLGSNGELRDALLDPDQFDADWAEVLAMSHPQIECYDFCVANESSLSFDYQLQNFPSSLLPESFFDEEDVFVNWNALTEDDLKNHILGEDPFFAVGGFGDSYLAEMTDWIDQGLTCDGTDQVSVLDFIDCSSLIEESPATRLSLVIGMYLDKKREFVDLASSDYGCVNEDLCNLATPDLSFSDEMQAQLDIDSIIAQNCQSLCTGQVDYYMTQIIQECDGEISPADQQNLEGQLSDFCMEYCGPSNPFGIFYNNPTHLTGQELVQYESDLLDLNAYIQSLCPSYSFVDSIPDYGELYVFQCDENGCVPCQSYIEGDCQILEILRRIQATVEDQGWTFPDSLDNGACQNTISMGRCFETTLLSGWPICDPAQGDRIYEQATSHSFPFLSNSDTAYCAGATTLSFYNPSPGRISCLQMEFKDEQGNPIVLCDISAVRNIRPQQGNNSPCSDSYFCQSFSLDDSDLYDEPSGSILADSIRLSNGHVEYFDTPLDLLDDNSSSQLEQLLFLNGNFDPSPDVTVEVDNVQNRAHISIQCLQGSHITHINGILLSSVVANTIELCTDCMPSNTSSYSCSNEITYSGTQLDEIILTNGAKLSDFVDVPLDLDLISETVGAIEQWLKLNGSTAPQVLVNSDNLQFKCLEYTMPNEIVINGQVQTVANGGDCSSCGPCDSIVSGDQDNALLVDITLDDGTEVNGTLEIPEVSRCFGEGWSIRRECVPQITLIPSIDISVQDLVEECIEDQQEEALVILTELYEQTIDSVIESLLREIQCFPREEEFSVKYKSTEHHYTLYYYSLAGNLLRTIPPEGVRPLDNSNFDGVTGEWNGTNPNHLSEYFTDYLYNSQNQVIAQKTPSAGITTFDYDFAQRLRISQNSRQIVEDKYSYTKYDDLNRIIEVGEHSASQEPEVMDLNESSWPINNTSEVTQTFYEEGLTGSTFDAKNLRNRVSATQNEHLTTEYSYDAHGNVKNLRHSLAELPSFTFDIEMEYDLVSGNVHEVKYQGGKNDEYYHRYEYDADNRLVRVHTSSDGFLYERDAEYKYYAHGPMARMEIGQDRIQGLDYIYTLQGWIKGLNGQVISEEGRTVSGMFSHDVGRDGRFSSLVALDEMAYFLHYYDGDYQARGLDAEDERYMRPSPKLYNGNISAMEMRLRQMNDMPRYHEYRYDQLHRIVSMSSALHDVVNVQLEDIDLSSEYSYDGNGNLESLHRTIDNAPLDDLTYHYNTLRPNILDFVSDGSSNPQGAAPQSSGNYLYDQIGQLKSDLSNGIQNIEWTLYNKVQSAEYSDGTRVSYSYDPQGNRLSKTRGDKTTYYIRDASGNLLSTYSRLSEEFLLQKSALIYGSSHLGQDELNRVIAADPEVDLSYVNIWVGPSPGNWHGSESYWSLGRIPVECDHLYIFAPDEVSIDVGNEGLGRTLYVSPGGFLDVPLGATLDIDPMNSTCQDFKKDFVSDRGQKRYHLNDWLGTPRVVVTDQKHFYPELNLGKYQANVVSAIENYPFGLSLPQTQYSNPSYSQSIQYGFNGKEQDTDLQSDDGSNLVLDYGFRIYNPAIARFLSVDPLTRSYPELTPYQFASNRPIDGVDLDGLEYVTRIHYVHSTQPEVVKSTDDILWYKMSDFELKMHGGTPKSSFNAAGFGPLGEGVQHVFIDENGSIVDEHWDLPRNTRRDKATTHGLYSGEGCITNYSNNSCGQEYDFNFQPVDVADAIAKAHDIAYDVSAGKNSLGFVEDVRTLQADRDMVARVRMALEGATASQMGLENPVRNDISRETQRALKGQEIVIGLLAYYKNWKNNQPNNGAGLTILDPDTAASFVSDGLIREEKILRALIVPVLQEMQQQYLDNQEESQND